MELPDIQTALSSLKAAVEIAKSIRESKSREETHEKVANLQGSLIENQLFSIALVESHHKLAKRVEELEDLLKKANDWGDQEKRYTLICPWHNLAQVYALKGEHSNEESPHFVCTNCFHNKKRVILGHVISARGFARLICPSCRASIDTGYRHHGAPKYAEEYS